MDSAVKIRCITTLSATLEFYDFTLLIFLSGVIARVFFPEGSAMSGVMPVLILFFAGYLARFAGGLMYSHFGDRYGRKKPYIYSVLLMSLATPCIAVLPGADEWGVFAPLSLLVLRIIQGLSLGGEIPGAVVFAAEHTRPGRRGQVTGLVISGVTFGNVLATATVTALYHYLSDDQVVEWGWRVAFMTGGILGLISLWLRLSLEETPVFKESVSGHRPVVPVIHLLRSHRISLIRGCLVAIFPAVTTSILLFMPRYQLQFQNIDPERVFSISFWGFLILTVVTLFMAVVTDKTGRIPMIRLGCCLALPIVVTFNSIGISPFWALMPLFISCSMVMGAYEASMVELFPTRSRYSGVAFCHNLAFALFAGSTPMLLEWFCSLGLVMAPAYLVAFYAMLLLLSTCGWEDRYQDELSRIPAE
ncbi:MFS transporter [Endozoicomonas lisbonensis]|uniref:MHS family proline/betaine transporter-like MFS transporter n=1 Tax=Endozoicomonas lisbonensis TaxID=3120522 RepID=A0ABV2SC51_9GAMM